jgi:hypothetical protein
MLAATAAAIAQAVRRQEMRVVIMKTSVNRPKGHGTECASESARLVATQLVERQQR